MSRASHVERAGERYASVASAESRRIPAPGPDTVAAPKAAPP